MKTVFKQYLNTKYTIKMLKIRKTYLLSNHDTPWKELSKNRMAEFPAPVSDANLTS